MRCACMVGVLGLPGVDRGGREVGSDGGLSSVTVFPSPSMIGDSLGDVFGDARSDT